MLVSRAAASNGGGGAVLIEEPTVMVPLPEPTPAPVQVPEGTPAIPDAPAAPVLEVLTEGGLPASAEVPLGSEVADARTADATMEEAADTPQDDPMQPDTVAASSGGRTILVTRFGADGRTGEEEVVVGTDVLAALRDTRRRPRQ